jgi:uncharacterized OB-fold protein
MTDVPTDRYTRPFWEGLANGEFHINWCSVCDSPFFPPAPVCPFCGDRDVSWQEVDPTGRLYSFTRQHTVAPGFEAPLVLGLVELDAGPRLLAPIAAPYEDLTIGTAVELVPVEYDCGYNRGDLAGHPYFEAVPAE